MERHLADTWLPPPSLLSALAGIVVADEIVAKAEGRSTVYLWDELYAAKHGDDEFCSVILHHLMDIAACCTDRARPLPVRIVLRFPPAMAGRMDGAFVLLCSLLSPPPAGRPEGTQGLPYFTGISTIVDKVRPARVPADCPRVDLVTASAPPQEVAASPAMAALAAIEAIERAPPCLLMTTVQR